MSLSKAARKTKPATGKAKPLHGETTPAAKPKESEGTREAMFVYNVYMTALSAVMCVLCRAARGGGAAAAELRPGPRSTPARAASPFRRRMRAQPFHAAACCATARAAALVPPSPPRPAPLPQVRRHRLRVRAHRLVAVEQAAADRPGRRAARLHALECVPHVAVHAQCTGCSPAPRARATFSPARRAPALPAVNFISKPTEFLDTYFMAVKGNFRQMTVLHVSHHAIMPIIMYILIEGVSGAAQPRMRMASSYAPPRTCAQATRRPSPPLRAPAPSPRAVPGRQLVRGGCVWAAADSTHARRAAASPRRRLAAPPRRPRALAAAGASAR